jgi:hypothetical protein
MEQSFDEARVSACLKEIDDRLSLWPPDATSAYYRVVQHVSDWQSAVVVVTWMDADREPLPLSSGLVDEVQKWRPENRGKRGPDSDEINERRVEQARRTQDEVVAAVKDDHRAKLERGRVSVSMGSMKRKPAYQRNPDLPASVRRY